MAICKPEDDVYRCNKKWRRALRRREAGAMRVLTDAYRQAYKQLQGELETLLEEIAAQDEATEWQSIQNLRYEAMMAQVKAELARLEQLTADVTTEAQTDALDMATNAVVEQLATAKVTVSFAGFPLEAYETLVGMLADGTPLVEHLATTLQPEALQRLHQSLLSGLAAGWNPRKVARMAAQRTIGLTLGRAMTIARTEMLRAYREGTRVRYREAGIEEWVWLSALDRRTCAACLALHGRHFKVEEPQQSHPNCRCTSVPVLKGVDYGIQSGAAWLAQQPPEVQDEVLGKAGGLAFRTGAVQLDDFVGKKRNRRWGAMYYRRSLTEILGEKAEEWKRKAIGQE